MLLATSFKLLLAFSIAVRALDENDDPVYDHNGKLVVFEDGRLAKRGGGHVYCAFYSDDYCKDQVGDVHYDVENHNCFWNYGRYMRCGTGRDSNWRLIQSQNDTTCGCQENCTQWADKDKERCWDLNQWYGPYGNYHFEQIDAACPPRSCT